MSYTLSTDQAEALRQIGAWYRSKSAPYMTLGGYAGTGKTTLVAYLRQALHQLDPEARVAFCAYTGKASRVLQERLKDQKVPRRSDTVSTIHSLIYTSKEGLAAAPVWELKEAIDRNLIIVDEASMVDEQIWKDLLSFKIPILAVGDHGQLPPVGSSFNLMKEPQIRLERIWRQAEDSAIIEVATMARETGQIAVGSFGEGVRKLDRAEAETGQIVQEMLESWKPELLLLCGYNATRSKLNQAIRGYRDYESLEPQVGDRVVCLRNNRVKKIFNGMLGEIRSIVRDGNDPLRLWYDVEIAVDGEDYPYYGYILRDQFNEAETKKVIPLAPDGERGDLWDFGYALTVHKAQGSQSESVLVFEEKFAKSSEEDWRRWLYTAVTRASVKLTIVGPNPDEKSD
jgi:exodeoxyribonuclease-5